jgi:mono/diheme cytochrome c family protein
MMKSRIAWLLLLACGASLPAAAQDVTLIPGPGMDVVAAGCSICHTLSYIPMNSRFMTPDVWKAEVAKMRTAFGAPIDDDAANAIVTYLVANYGVPAK